MSHRLAFHKLSACGNDFVAIDNRELALSGQETRLIQWLCERRSCAGADGVLFVEPSDEADFRMRIFNPDGSEAWMCGNGARACASFASRIGIKGNPLQFDTRAGLQRVRTDEQGSRLWLSSPHGKDTELTRLRADHKLLDTMSPGIQPVGFVRVGVPHLVLDCATNATDQELERFAVHLAHHEAFGQEGCNVMFAHRVAGNLLTLRAWEKGVEAETWGCGTGAVASCLLLDEVKPLQFPLVVEMKGGNLTVFREGAELSFSGEVHHAFEAVTSPPDSLFQK